MFGQHHPAATSESTHLPYVVWLTLTYGALVECPAASRLGKIPCDYPRARSGRQPERPGLQRHDSGMSVEMPYGCSGGLPTSCPIVTSVNSTTIEQLPAVQPTNDPRNLWTSHDQTSSLQASDSIRLLESSHPSTGNVPAISMYDALLTADTNAVMNFASDVHNKPAWRESNTKSTVTCSPSRSPVHSNKITSRHHSHGSTVLNGRSLSGARQTSPKLPGMPSRVPHKLVERRYRDKMKAHLDTLSSKIPAIQLSYPCAFDFEDSPGGLKGPPKAVIIAGAIKYIEELESEREETRLFIERLQGQVAGLQKLVKCDDCSLLRYFANAKPEIVDDNGSQ